MSSKQLFENYNKHLEEEFIPNYDGEKCPICGSNNYFETDDEEYEDGTQVFHLECLDCGHKSNKHEFNHNDLNESLEELDPVNKDLKIIFDSITDINSKIKTEQAKQLMSLLEDRLVDIINDLSIEVDEDLIG